MRVELSPRANQAIRKNDLVQVIAGKESGKRGKVIEVRNFKERVVVEKVNLVKKHQKPNAQNRQGGIVEKEAAMHLSNVQLVCAKCNRPVRVRWKAEKGAEAERMCALCGEKIEKKKA